MNTENNYDTVISRLHQVLNQLKSKFVGKDDIIDLMGICLTAGENLFLLGPPGTAKSALVRELAKQLHGKTFEYLLTRFTEPNELFGPFDIRKLREGELLTNTDGMLPEANLIFLDELLNANSAILNSLLMVLNEKVFRRGRENKALPALMIVGASNYLPEDEALQALFDRFLLRVHCDYVDPELLGEVLEAGWKLNENREVEATEGITSEEVVKLQSNISTIDLQPIRTAYISLIEQLRNAGIQVSDRRAVKLQRIIAASALLCSRTAATISDMWVLRYIWDTDDQQEIIAGIVNKVLESDQAGEGHHPAAHQNTLPDPEAIYKEVESLQGKWNKPDTNLAERSTIKDRLRYLNSRSQWISNEVQRNYVQKPIQEFWEQIIQTKTEELNM